MLYLDFIPDTYIYNVHIFIVSPIQSYEEKNFFNIVWVSLKCATTCMRFKCCVTLFMIFVAFFFLLPFNLIWKRKDHPYCRKSQNINFIWSKAKQISSSLFLSNKKKNYLEINKQFKVILKKKNTLLFKVKR